MKTYQSKKSKLKSRSNVPRSETAKETTYSSLQPKLKTIIQKLINKDQEVDLRDIFIKSGVEDQVQGEYLFKQTIEGLVSQPYNSKSRRWARQIKGDGYRVRHYCIHLLCLPYLFCIRNADNARDNIL